MLVNQLRYEERNEMLENEWETEKRPMEQPDRSWDGCVCRGQVLSSRWFPVGNRMNRYAFRSRCSRSYCCCCCAIGYWCNARAGGFAYLVVFSIVVIGPVVSVYHGSSKARRHGGCHCCFSAKNQNIQKGGQGRRRCSSIGKRGLLPQADGRVLETRRRSTR